MKKIPAFYRNRKFITVRYEVFTADNMPMLSITVGTPCRLVGKSHRSEKHTVSISTKFLGNAGYLPTCPHSVLTQLKNIDVLYRVQKSPLLDYNLSQLNAVNNIFHFDPS
jgi:hypothetical protein